VPKLTEPVPRAFAVLAILIAVSATSLGGGWVYDDLHMVGNAAMDEAADVLAALWRTSDDYLPPSVHGATRTFRPATMVTLVATHVAAPSPVAHRIVSLFLHALVVLLLLSWERRHASAWTLAVAAFALHPALAEAWLYVNGRSDLVAGLCLAGLWRALRMRHRATPFACAIFALLGALSKETFVVAAPFVLLATLLERSRDARRRVLASAAGIVAAIGVAAALGPDLGAGGSTARLLDPRMASHWPALIGLGAETIALPWPRPMRSLAHELGPAAGAHLAALVIVVAAVAALAIKRRLRALLHVLGAVAVLLPTALVSDVFWLGFDRYLYMPMILIVTACAPELRAIAIRRRAALGSASALAVLGVLTAASGLAYASHEAMIEAMIARRREDPTGYLLGASERAQHGDPAGAFALVERIQADQLTGASAHQTASILHRLERPELVIMVVEEAHRREPDHPFVRLDLVALRGAQGRFDEALDLAERLREEPGFCDPVRAELEGWATASQVPAAERTRAAYLARPCAAR